MMWSMLHLPPLAEQLLFVLLGVAIVALLARNERRTLFGVLVIYLFSVVFSVSSDIASHSGYAMTAKSLDFVSLVFAGIALLNLGATFIFSVILRRLRVEPPRIVRDLLVAVAYIAFVLFLFSQYKVDITGIIATSAVITAVIGFSLQDVLGNVMGGLALQLDRTFAPGDWIRFGDNVNGIVREISWRRTVVETRNGDRIAIPNSLLMKNQVMVQGRLWNGETRQRRWVYFDIPYKHTPTRVMEIVSEALNREPIARVARDPQPHVILFEFREGWGKYAARYWLTDIAQDDLTDSTVRTRIYYALRRAEIPFALPQTEIGIHRASEKETPFGEPTHDARVNVLRSVPLFASLTREEIERVAAKLIYSPFVPGEAVLVQGHAVHHLYILASGVVEVRVAVDGGPSSPVAKMMAPNFFGEGGMLTGQPRSATIIALTDVECWRLDKEGFQEILHARPEIAEEISHVVAMRRVELMEVTENLSEEVKRQRIQTEKHNFLGRVRDFFGLE